MKLCVWLNQPQTLCLELSFSEQRQIKTSAVSSFIWYFFLLVLQKTKKKIALYLVIKKKNTWNKTVGFWTFHIAMAIYNVPQVHACIQSSFKLQDCLIEDMWPLYVTLLLNFEENQSLLVNSWTLQKQAVVFLEAPENFMHIALVVVFPRIYEFSEEAQSFLTQLQKLV